MAKIINKKKLLAIVVVAVFGIAGAGFTIGHFAERSRVQAACSEAKSIYDAAQTVLKAAQEELAAARADAQSEAALGFADDPVNAALITPGPHNATSSDSSDGTGGGVMSTNCDSEAAAESITAAAETVEESASSLSMRAKSLTDAVNAHVINAVNTAQQEAVTANAAAVDAAEAVIKRATDTEGYATSDGAPELISAVEEAIKESELSELVATSRADSADVIAHTEQQRAATKTLADATEALTNSLDEYDDAVLKAAQEAAEAARKSDQAGTNQPGNNKGGTKRPGNSTSGGNSGGKPAGSCEGGVRSSDRDYSHCPPPKESGPAACSKPAEWRSYSSLGTVTGCVDGVLVTLGYWVPGQGTPYMRHFGCDNGDARYSEEWKAQYCR